MLDSSSAKSMLNIYLQTSLLWFQPREKRVPWTGSIGWAVPLITALLVLSAGCNPTQAAKLSDEATAQLHRQVADEHDDAIYAAAAADYRKFSSEEDLVRMNSILRRKLGACGEFHRQRIGFETNFNGTFVTTQVSRSKRSCGRTP